MRTIFDILSKLILKALNLLFVGNPLRTSLGVVVGFFIHSLSTIFTPAITLLLKDYVDISQISEFNCIFIGLVIVYFPTIISFLGDPKKELLDESLEKVFRLIEFAEQKGGITKTQIRALCIKLCEKAVEQINFNEAIKKELEQLNQLETETEKQTD